jgi:hypothetical protein
VYTRCDIFCAIVKSASLALGVLLVSHCDTTLDTELEGKRCSANHACLPGYACSAENRCVRPSKLNTSSSSWAEDTTTGSTKDTGAAGALAGKGAAGQGRAGSEPPDIPILTAHPPGWNAGVGGVNAGSGAGGRRSAVGAAGSAGSTSAAGAAVAGKGAAGTAGASTRSRASAGVSGSAGVAGAGRGSTR